VNQVEARPVNIVVCVKPVPGAPAIGGGAGGASGGPAAVDPARHTVNREGLTLVPNRNDKVALETALRLREQAGGGVVTAVLMGPPQAETVARECLAFGADEAWLLSDRALAGSDALATARTLAAAVRRRGRVDLILTGVESSDGGTGQVGPTLATLLGLYHLTAASAVRLTGNGATAATGGLGFEVVIEDAAGTTFEAEAPLLVTMARTACRPRTVTMMGIVKARSRPLVTLDCRALGVDPAQVGEAGSPTRVSRLLPYKVEKKAEMLSGDLEEQARGLARLLMDKGCLGGGAARD